MTIPSALLAQYRLLVSSASGDTVEDHPMTRHYTSRFQLLVADIGLREARAWLLGALIRDLHPDTSAVAHHSCTNRAQAANSGVTALH